MLALQASLPYAKILRHPLELGMMIGNTNSNTTTCLCKLACPGLVCHVIVPLKANQGAVLPQPSLVAQTVHFFTQDPESVG